jgi:ABC-type multidrug transport system fused ATPase/permease subunit
VRILPYADPGIPDTRSPARLLLWLALGQKAAIFLAAVLGVIWMLAQAVMPLAIGNGINEVVDGDTAGALRWAAVAAVLGVTQALVGIVRHRAAVANWLYSAFRVIQLIGRHSARTGPAVPNTIPTGDVVATTSSDAHHIGHVFEVISRFAGAMVAYLVVSLIVMRTSLVLGLLVLIGVPVLVLGLTPIIRPFQHRQRAFRESLGKLTSLGADTVVGLRVLRGIGGERVFAGRYKEKSEQVRRKGVRLATMVSILDSFMVLLPGAFLVLLTWVGARLVMDGTAEPGTLVMLYGFAFFLMIPVRTAGEMTFVATRALVGAKRVLKVLDIERDVPTAPARVLDQRGNGHGPSASGLLVDSHSGLSVRPGELTMLASSKPAEAIAVADRLGRLVPGNGVTLDGVPLDAMALADVRRRVVVSDPEPMLFTGTVRTALDPAGEHDDATLLAALDAAAAGDVLDSVQVGLDGIVDERARSLSGGQRQRVALARALVRDPQILILVEPTSAVDAHTEAAIAANLRRARAGKTTLVVSASPLLLTHADTVAWLIDGTVAATGTHDELLTNVPDYRRSVTREEVLA